MQRWIYREYVIKTKLFFKALSRSLLLQWNSLMMVSWRSALKKQKPEEKVLKVVDCLGENVNMLSVWVSAQSLQSCLNLCDPMKCSQQFLCPWWFSRQEYWNGFSYPPPGDLPDPGTEPMSHISCIGRQVLYHQCHQILGLKRRGDRMGRRGEETRGERK